MKDMIKHFNNAYVNKWGCYLHYILKDVYTTGFSAEACGIERINNPGFNPFQIQRRKFDRNQDILVHYNQNPIYKHKIKAQIAAAGILGKCNKTIISS